MSPLTRAPPVPPTLVGRLFQRKVVPFLGAGSSAAPPSSIPAAGTLAELLVQQGAGTDGQTLEDIAEDAWNRGGWQEFAQLLPIDEWRARTPNEVFRVLAEVAKEGLIGQILTTNWDVLLENALIQIGQPFSKVVDSTTLAIEPAGRVTVVKVNGCIDHPEFIKATRSQIESRDWLEAWARALFDVLVRMNSILFVGYSGASRAATTTVARLVVAGERQAEDFLVDTQPPEAIAASESGRQFVEAINLVEASTGDATAFFRDLRSSLYPRLLAEPHRRAVEMANALTAPTRVAGEDLVQALGPVVDAQVQAGPEALQRWLFRSFRSFSDCDAVKPYLPLLPNATDIGKCFLWFGVVGWAGRLHEGEMNHLEVPVLGDASRTVRVRVEVVVCHPEHRRDMVARTAVAQFGDYGQADPRLGSAAVGVIFGGLGAIDRSMRTFSVARGAEVPNAARGGGASMVWIEGDAVFAAFQQDGNADTVRATIQQMIDEAAATLTGG
jgi:hypothetical protein